VRLGHTGHKRLESLYTAGRAPIARAVIDAGHSVRQKDLVATLSNNGAEIILDTKAAELASAAGIHTKAAGLPWGKGDAEQTPADWAGANGQERARLIAEFAVAGRVDTVLSPAHLIKRVNSPWLATDLQTTHYLRRALDRAGGEHIRIDYPLMVPVSLLKDVERLNALLQGLRAAPVGNVWLRIAGFGMDGTPSGTRRCVEAAWRLADLGKPLIGDQVGGLVGLSLAAFGATGGLCQGVAEKENFNVSAWGRHRSRKGGSSERRIYLPSLDMFLYQSKAKTLMAGRNVRALLTCHDRQCCRSPDDIFNQWQAHALTQSFRAIEELNGQPELKRIDYVLDRMLTLTGRNLRTVKKTKIDDPVLSKRLAAKSDRIDLMQQTLERLNDQLEAIPVALTPITKRNPVKKAG
jgi:hypothetical protein